MLKFKLNSAGVRAILKSEEMYNECEGYAAKIQESAGEGYEVRRRDYPERTSAGVYPSTKKANRDNLKNNTLEKALRSVK